MLKDVSGGKILDSFRDENLDKGGLKFFADDLRRVPLEQRQNFMAEVFSRTKSSITRKLPGGLLVSEIQHTGVSTNEAVSQILDENGW